MTKTETNNRCGTCKSNFKGFIKHCPEDTLQLDLHCGYKKAHVEEFLFEAEHYTSRGIQELFLSFHRNIYLNLFMQHLWSVCFYKRPNTLKTRSGKITKAMWLHLYGS